MFTKDYTKSSSFFQFCSMTFTGCCIMLIVLGIVLGIYKFAGCIAVGSKSQVIVGSIQHISKYNQGAQPVSKPPFEESYITCTSVTFEEEVASEIKRVCSDIYPDLDSNYILAMVYHESRFQKDVLNSKTGATGLMQILPQWHTARAESLGVNLNDWKGNILVGCDILNEMIQKKGSMRYAVNFYAGGYSYADYYERSGKLSPYEKSISNILSSGVLEELEVM